MSYASAKVFHYFRFSSIVSTVSCRWAKVIFRYKLGRILDLHHRGESVLKKDCTLPDKNWFKKIYIIWWSLVVLYQILILWKNNMQITWLNHLGEKHKNSFWNLRSKNAEFFAKTYVISLAYNMGESQFFQKKMYIFCLKMVGLYQILIL